MVRSAAWRFLEMGQRIERAQGLCRMAARSAPNRATGARWARCSICATARSSTAPAT
ncbi:alpha-E domain-containing protein [Novosphingobium colocasiae]